MKGLSLLGALAATGEPPVRASAAPAATARPGASFLEQLRAALTSSTRSTGTGPAEGSTGTAEGGSAPSPAPPDLLTRAVELEPVEPPALEAGSRGPALTPAEGRTPVAPAPAAPAAGATAAREEAPAGRLAHGLAAPRPGAAAARAAPQEPPGAAARASPAVLEPAAPAQPAARSTPPAPSCTLAPAPGPAVAAAGPAVQKDVAAGPAVRMDASAGRAVRKDAAAGAPGPALPPGTEGAQRLPEHLAQPRPPAQPAADAASGPLASPRPASPIQPAPTGTPRSVGPSSVAGDADRASASSLATGPGRGSAQPGLEPEVAAGGPARPAPGPRAAPGTGRAAPGVAQPATPRPLPPAQAPAAGASPDAATGELPAARTPAPPTPAPASAATSFEHEAAAQAVAWSAPRAGEAPPAPAPARPRSGSQPASAASPAQTARAPDLQDPSRQEARPPAGAAPSAGARPGQLTSPAPAPEAAEHTAPGPSPVGIGSLEVAAERPTTPRFAGASPGHARSRTDSPAGVARPPAGPPRAEVPAQPPLAAARASARATPQPAPVGATGLATAPAVGTAIAEAGPDPAPAAAPAPPEPPPSALEGLEGLELSHATWSPRPPAASAGASARAPDLQRHPRALWSEPRTRALGGEDPGLRAAAGPRFGGATAAAPASMPPGASGRAELVGEPLQAWSPARPGRQAPAPEAAPRASVSRAAAEAPASEVRPHQGDAEAALSAAKLLATPSVRPTLFDTRGSELKAAASQHLTDAVATKARTALAPSKLSLAGAPAAPAPKARPGEAAAPGPEADERRRLRPEEGLAPPIAGASRPTAPLDLAVAPLQVPPAIAQAFEAVLPQLLEDPSLRIALGGAQARVSVDTGEGGQLSLQLKVHDGVTEIRATGPAAPLMEARQNELRVALAGEGLSLGHFDLGQSGSQQRQDRPEAPDRDHPQPPPPPRPGGPASEAATPRGRVHVRA